MSTGDCNWCEDAFCDPGQLKCYYRQRQLDKSKAKNSVRRASFCRICLWIRRLVCSWTIHDPGRVSPAERVKRLEEKLRLERAKRTYWQDKYEKLLEDSEKVFDRTAILIQENSALKLLLEGLPDQNNRSGFRN